MRLRIIAGAGALVLAAAGSAAAADIPPAPVYKAPVAVPAPSSWYGFYIGVHGGYGFGRDSVISTPDAFYNAVFGTAGIPLSQAGDPRGAIAGVQWGSNWQFGRVVLGTDSDFSWTDIKASQTSSGLFVGIPLSATVEQKLKWFGTTRVRGGFLIGDNLLVYATGGLASGRVSSSEFVTVNLPGGCVVPGPCPGGSSEKDRWGWTLGGGIELSDGPWQWRAEYLHYDLGTVSYTIFDPLVPGFAVANSTRFSGDIVRGAISYRFNWTPWELIFGRN